MAEWFVAVAGLLLIAGAIAATQPWLDRHFLPSFLMSRQGYVRIEASIRLALAALGVAIVLAARRAPARLTGPALPRTLRTVVAIAAALGASGVALRRVHLRPAQLRAVEGE